MGRPWLLYLRGLALDRGHRRGKELNLGRGDRQNFKKRVSSFVQVSYQYGLRKRLSSASKAASTLDLELIRTILCGVDSLVSLTVVRDYVSTCEMPDITDVIKILAGRLGQKSPNSRFFFFSIFYPPEPTLTSHKMETLDRYGRFLRELSQR